MTALGGAGAGEVHRSRGTSVTAGGRILRPQPAEAAGLFFVGAAPGAPLMTRNIAKRGFDMQLAAGYQVWGGLLTPIVLPLVVLVADLFSRRTCA